MESTFDLLTLTLVPRLTPRAAATLLARGLGDVLTRPGEHGDLLGAVGTAALRSGCARRAAEAEEKAARRQGIAIVGRDEHHYPQWLRATHTPPLVLWVRGTLVPGEGAAAIAVVGARAATPRGLAFARRLSSELAAAGLVVVSGLARGIDSAAHRGALEAGGRTVAILGSGLDRLYPPENGELAARVEASGALVSEFPLGTGPWKANFPRRNRVVAGWVHGVVVVEAGRRSGALSTARAALEEGREVMAVPGHPMDPQAEGTNGLLRDGAALVLSADDALGELGLSRPRPREPRTDDAVLRALASGAPATIDEIQLRSGLALPQLLARISELELASAVERLPGALYVRAGAGTGGYTRPE